MPELRQNMATKEWVIIASERSKRPNVFAETQNRVRTEDRDEHVGRCPFCPGNEELDLEVERFPTDGPWKTRVVRNKFPAVAEEGLPTRTLFGVHRCITAVGYHDVVVEHPKHNTTLALITPDDVRVVLETFQRRGREIARDPRVEHITYFKNHGERAGASLQHPHSQIISLPVVPNGVRRRIEESRRFYEDTGECVICTMLADELSCRERLVVESEHFAVFVLYAALSPFHMWIVPRQHCGNFLDVSHHELADLAGVLRNVLRRVYIGLNDPDYNMIIRTGPVKEAGNIHLHWYISLVLRVSRLAGFEMGSGIHINPCPPEQCAGFLRDIPL